MANMSKIEWTETTWNPIRGCSRVSPGCVNCYAERIAARFSKEGRPFEGIAKMTKAGPRWTHKIRLLPEKLEEPFHWKKPRKVFVNSMSDLFHPDVPLEFIQKMFVVMEQAPQHVFQILTKRGTRLQELDSELSWTQNVWMGVSVENQDYLERIRELQQTHAHIKFLSLEPLLGPLPNLDLTGIDWVIVGGESVRLYGCFR